MTNFSTGELGIVLANTLASAGFEVVCFRGVSASCTRPLQVAQVMPFSTNENLLAGLESLPERESVGAVFHAAALADYAVKSVHRIDGTQIAAAKIPTSEGDLVLRLSPALKVIGQLRQLFPVSRIVGWKYELNGSRGDALGAAVKQIDAHRTDACVVNGNAYGPGFGFVEPGEKLVQCADKQELGHHLVSWLGGGNKARRLMA